MATNGIRKCNVIINVIHSHTVLYDDKIVLIHNILDSGRSTVGYRMCSDGLLTFITLWCLRIHHIDGK